MCRDYVHSRICCVEDKWHCLNVSYFFNFPCICSTNQCTQSIFFLQSSWHFFGHCIRFVILLLLLLLLYLFQSSQKPIQLPSVCINEILETLWRNQEDVAIEVYFGKQDDTNSHFISHFRICFWFRLSICLIHRQAAEYVRRLFKSHTVRVRSLFYFMNKNIEPFHCQRRIWLLANPELSNEIGTCYLVLKTTCPRANFDPSPCLTNYNSKVWIGAF